MENEQLQVPRDRISNIPDNVTETILIRLPTLDAVRTTILSRKWRHVWTKLPQFVLDQTFWKKIAEKSCAEITLTMILNHILLPHDGPIKKFTLSNRGLKSCTEINNLIRFLAKSHLEDFTLEMWKDRYLLPSSFFCCDKLKHLRLRSCEIRRSVACQGFSRLTTLTLIHVAITSNTLERLISGSPLLSTLELTVTSGHIRIDATNLKTFIFFGCTKSINFKRVPILSSLSIKQNDSEGIVNFVGVGCDTLKFFQMFPFIESLELSHHILLAFVNVKHIRLPTSLMYLKELKLYELTFNDMVDISFTFCVLRSSPNLKFMKIEFEDYDEELYSDEEIIRYIEGEDYSDMCLNRLKEVNLKGIIGTKPELIFIRLLLANSSSLKKLQVQPHEKGVDDGGLELLKELIKFPRISKEAEILFVA